MASILALWRAEPRNRWFFLAHLQGSLGAGVGYVALMVFAYERIGSAWAATAVLLVLNAATFVVSAVLLARLGGTPRQSQASRETLLGETRAGIRAVITDPITRTLMCTSGAVVLVAGTTNVAELVLAQRELGAGSSGFALLVCAYGCGVVSGSLLGAGDTDEEGLRRRYLLGLVLLAAGLAGLGTLLVWLLAARALRRGRPVVRPVLAPSA